MNRKAIWIGIGVLFFLAVGSGYLPDLALSSELSKARQAGLLEMESRPPIPNANDARPLYQAAAGKYGDAVQLLGSDFAAQVKTPSAHVMRYLDAMAAASVRPLCSPPPAADRNQYPSREGVLFTAAKALAIRSTDEKGLLAAARIGGHLNQQRTIESTGYWSLTVDEVFDRANKLNLSIKARSELSTALAPTLAPRDLLRQHVADSVRDLEIDARENGRRVGRSREETGYLRFWREFFQQHRPDPHFSVAIKNSNDAIENTQSIGGYNDLTPFVGTAGPAAWNVWAEGIEKADQRLATGR